MVFIYFRAPDSPIRKKYTELMDKHHAKWLSDGNIDLKNNIRLSLGDYLPLSNEMIFTILYNRDPHQLFELICIQMQSVVLAYTEGLKEILKYSPQRVLVDYNPSDLLNYIFDGYTKVSTGERNIATLFFEIETGHLLQFHLSLGLVYKRMYQRWIYLELQKLVPECILKLKELDYDENYTTLVQKFIKFDDVMTTVTQAWRDIWLLIHNYHKSRTDVVRRRRISIIHSLFVAIRDSEFDFDENLNLDDKPLVDWITAEDRRTVWQYVVHKIKSEWLHCTHPRLLSKVLDINCTKCKSPFVPHFVSCTCNSCLIAGGPCFSKIKENSKNSICTKCTFFEKFMNGTVVKNCLGKTTFPDEKVANYEAASKLDRDLYHLSWAIFKHHEDRVPYTSNTFDPIIFCMFQEVPCTRFACRIAANIITQTYPPNFSKFLVKNYRPLDEGTRKAIMTIQKIDVQPIKYMDASRIEDAFTVNKKLHPLHVTDRAWLNDDNRLSNDESIKRASALAEGFLTDFQLPQKNIIFSYFYKLFRISGQDIDFNIEQLDLLKKQQPPSTGTTTASNCVNASGSSISSNYSTDSSTTSSSNKDDLMEDISTRMRNFKITNNKVLPRRERSDSTQTDPRAAADGETKKPLVEALQLAANNKKLEAELRSLQKEHSMLKDMVRDLEHIHDEKHQCSHEHEHDHESTDSKESKSSHRTEGQCICYYCTIFGQNDCSHNSRANETRDRLRKRLRKLQTTKESKPPTVKDILDYKPAPGTFKQIPNPTVAAATSKPVTKPQDSCCSKQVPVVPASLSAPVVQQKPPQPNLQRPVEPKPVVTQARPPTIKAKRQLLSPIKRPVEPMRPAPPYPEPTPISCAPVDDILRFIEGDDDTGSTAGASNSDKKDKDAAKRAAKKAKQKLRKLEQRKVVELEELKSQYEALCTEEIDLRKSLKAAKKRKNQNRIVEVTESLTNALSQKTEVLASANHLIATACKANPDFVFDFGVTEEKFQVVLNNTTTHQGKVCIKAN